MIVLCSFILYVHIKTVYGYEPRIINPINRGIFDPVLEGMDICSMGERNNCDIVPQNVKIPISELNYIGVVN